MTTTPVKVVDNNGSNLTWSWLAVPQSQAGDPVMLGRVYGLCVQVVGTFGSAGSLSIEGSNDGGTTWTIVKDVNGNACTFTGAALVEIGVRPLALRAHCTAGDGTTALNVYLNANRQ